MEEKDPWQSLKKFTDARIAIGRAGTGIPLRENLAFRMAHAHARDAVYSVLDREALAAALDALQLDAVWLHSQALNRHQYLQRPDLGRLPDEAACRSLRDRVAGSDVCIVIADGLSADAVNSHAVPLLQELVPMLQQVRYSLAPICITEQGRVAIADPIAALLQARLALMLIGERPGLTAADSLGAYLTYNPQPGLTDESRNCVSNIRPAGLGYQAAAIKIFYLVQQAFARRLSGVALKDDSERQLSEPGIKGFF